MVQSVTKEEAILSLRAAIFVVNDLDSRDYGRRLIHAFRGGFGADWDEDLAVRAINNATFITWATGMMGTIL